MDEEFEIEAFRPGTFTPMNGAPITFSAEQLSEIANAYDPDNEPAPIVIGHPQTDAPAFGWIKSLTFDGERQRLIARVGDVVPAFAEAVRAKRYRRVSMSFHPEAGSANPKPGTLYPRHLGFLGGTAPAVSGLKPVQFNDGGEAIVFNDPGFRPVARAFSRFRDWLIEREGVDAADEIIPHHDIEWIAEHAAEPEPMRHFASPSNTITIEEPPVADPTIEAREAELARREEALAAREADTRQERHVAFANELIEADKVLPAQRAEVIALFGALDRDGNEELSFAAPDGSTTTEAPSATLKRLLDGLPKVVTTGEQDLGSDPNTALPASFAAPPGATVDPADAALHAKATAYQAQHPDVDFITAVRAVS